MTKHTPITLAENKELQAAFDFFNKILFNHQLSDVFITYQRKPRMAGHFAPERYHGRHDAKQSTHELALNPDSFVGASDEYICQTIVHEMCHLWQHEHGTPASRGYHDKEWGAKMKAVGLYPSSTGKEGGKETGQRMSDYVIPQGRFAIAFKRLAEGGWKLNLQSLERSKLQSPQGPKAPKAPSSKTKFTCPGCEANVWGKPETNVVCGECELPMQAAS